MPLFTTGSPCTLRCHLPRAPSAVMSNPRCGASQDRTGNFNSGMSSLPAAFLSKSKAFVQHFQRAVRAPGAVVPVGAEGSSTRLAAGGLGVRSSGDARGAAAGLKLVGFAALLSVSTSSFGRKPLETEPGKAMRSSLGGNQHFLPQTRQVPRASRTTGR